jgi:hypothetical protein
MMDDTEKPIKVGLHPGFSVLSWVAAMRRREGGREGGAADAEERGGGRRGRKSQLRWVFTLAFPSSVGRRRCGGGREGWRSG